MSEVTSARGLQFDSNRWYQINVAQSGNQSLGSISPDSGTGRGGVFFHIKNETSPGQQWQIFTYNDTDVVIRSGRDPRAYLSAGLLDKSLNPASSTSPYLASRDLDTSMFWQLGLWNDGTYFLTNRANGTRWHLDLPENRQDGALFMSSNITAPQDGQRFTWRALGMINNDSFASIQDFPADMQNNTSSGLSDGAKIGIGVGVALVAILFSVLGVWFFIKRRRRRRARIDMPTYEEKVEAPPTYDASNKHSYGISSPVEAPSSERPAELDSEVTSQPPVELPGSMIQSPQTPSPRHNDSLQSG